ncbi:hypothetical protein [Sphingomonas hylomeconis]|uniref:Uncharacterized protein n=1 Tax=Sphingomonas hylomeconis TaxID=1395958 RepID=A0ABV7T0W5_9SPHN|nr:hypothetical protein [Sphingomonas hylomeconis]
MKFVVLAAALLLPAVASAQTATSAPVAPPAAPAPAASTAKFTLDTPLATIVADPAAKAVLDQDMPGTTTHPMFEQFKGMSLNQVAPMAGGAITPEMLAKTSADLAAIK